VFAFFQAEKNDDEVLEFFFSEMVLKSRPFVSMKSNAGMYFIFPTNFFGMSSGFTKNFIGYQRGSPS